MKDWTQVYRQRAKSAEEAVACIESGDTVYVSGNAATPYLLLDALAERAPELEDISVIHVLLLGHDRLATQEREQTFRHNALFVGPADRQAVNEGRADYIPIHLHDIPRLFTQDIIPLKAALIQTSPPDRYGFMSLGVECLASMAAIRSSVIIALVNDQMPRTLGNCFVHASRVDHVVEHSQALPELPRHEIGEVERQIGANVAGLVEDGDTLQLGIGAIPDATLEALMDKKDLGIHTEMVSDGVMEAVEAGVVTGSRKSLHRDKVVSTFALGSKRLYGFLDNNPLFEFHPTEYTNDPYVVSQNDRLVAVNSAVEVDLTGQVCSDSMGTRIYSGFGGQLDFIRGARRSKGGKPVIALPSTARQGTVSRIWPQLKPGAGVVTTRADVDYVVTEHGVASLFGKNLRQRAQELTAIAHPDFREELRQAAVQRRLVPAPAAVHPSN
ncbi:MAG TPA: acetyl-CoA hydrolase/transferase C-terminal domain-containing protein [Acidobacteriota bacterium]|nr:acetyl-CoA hydrolase/transferase C-terminal domain-containing protein [Acidobacteriota bacterium]